MLWIVVLIVLSLVFGLGWGLFLALGVLSFCLLTDLPRTRVRSVDAPHSAYANWNRARLKAMYYGTGVFMALYIVMAVSHSEITSTLFLVLPFFSSMLVARTVSWRDQVMRTCFLSLLVNILASFLFLGEGIICIVMASPIFVLMTWIGAAAVRGARFNDSRYVGPGRAAMFLVGGIFAFTAYDNIVLAHGAPIRSVSSEVTFAAPRERVWKAMSFKRASRVPISGWLGWFLPPPDQYDFKAEGDGAFRAMHYLAKNPHADGDTPRGTIAIVTTEWIPEDGAIFACVRNDTKIDKWFGLIDTRITLETLPAEPQKTRMRLTTRYQRHLGPGLYFNALMDYASEKMHEVLAGEMREGLR